MNKLNISVSRLFSPMKRWLGLYVAVVIYMPLMACLSAAQVHNASPSNWLYPQGNAAATRLNPVRSAAQDIRELTVKWSTAEISGDVAPLAGNLINNDRIMAGFPSAPNEIVAVMGDSVVILTAAGQVRKSGLPPYVKNVSALIDTMGAGSGQEVTRPVILGLESIEIENSDQEFVHTYLAGYDHNSDTVAVLIRLGIDLEEFAPNFFASIRPVFGKRADGSAIIYAAVNMSHPTADPFSDVPYFRGLALFNTGASVKGYPLQDIGDDIINRMIVAPEVAFAPPSIMNVGGADALAMPSFPSDTLTAIIDNFNNSITAADRAYVMSFRAENSGLSEQFPPSDHTVWINTTDSRPRIKSYYADIQNANTNGTITGPFLLVAEEYDGIDSSEGISKLHLYDNNGIMITQPGDQFNSPFNGGANHHWSVAVGDVDGSASNELLPYYPNNPGREIVVTQSTDEFAVAKSHIFIMRYYESSDVPKPGPGGDFLLPLDTIVSFRINGWVAAVNDLDGSNDAKEEILMVDGSRLMALRMKDYTHTQFRQFPFDTVWSRNFDRQTISSVAVADMEGDGRNDIIVTTHDSTYIIGTMIPGTIAMIEPTVQMTPPEEFCAGDSLSIRWENLMRGQDFVDIYFLPAPGGIPTGEEIAIAENYPNDADTVEYIYIVDQPLLGREGYFLVASSGYPQSINAPTSRLRFEMPLVSVDPLAGASFRAGETIEVTGLASCVDSVAIEYSSGTATWQRIGVNSIMPDGSFTVEADAPCADYFGCAGEDEFSEMNFRVVSFRANYADTSAVFPLNIMPALFPLTYDSCTTNCPTKLFEWDIPQMAFDCDTVSMSVSVDDGRSYTYIGSVPATDGEFLWLVPESLPDEITVRFCCENSCIRIDTTLQNYKAKYIQIVSPNPFKPPMEEVEIVYTVPEETNVTMRIFDQNNRLVAEPVNGAMRQPGITYCDRWDGRIHHGGLAANGMYYLILELSNGQKEIYSIFLRK